MLHAVPLRAEPAGLHLLLGRAESIGELDEGCSSPSTPRRGSTRASPRRARRSPSRSPDSSGASRFAPRERRSARRVQLQHEDRSDPARALLAAVRRRRRRAASTSCSFAGAPARTSSRQARRTGAQPAADGAPRARLGAPARRAARAPRRRSWCAAKNLVVRDRGRDHRFDLEIVPLRATDHAARALPRAVRGHRRADADRAPREGQGPQSRRHRGSIACASSSRRPRSTCTRS